jgi:hypothetical protein
LQEAEDFWCLIAAGAGDAKIMCKLSTLNERSVLVLNGEEAGSESFFPKIKASLVPVLTNVA